MTKKVDKTQRELLQGLYQGIYGVPDTEDRGLTGDVKDTLKLIKDQNSRVRSNERKIFKIWGILIGVGVAAGIGVGLGLKMLGI